jgi:hypothetical protein
MILLFNFELPIISSLNSARCLKAPAATIFSKMSLMRDISKLKKSGREHAAGGPKPYQKCDFLRRRVDFRYGEAYFLSDSARKMCVHRDTGSVLITGKCRNPTELHFFQTKIVFR